MGSKSIKIQVVVLFWLILANFVAQVPYYLHLYEGANNLLVQVRSILILLVLLAIFLFACWRLRKQTRLGYWLVLAFMAVEFFFYLGNTLMQVVQWRAFLPHFQGLDLIIQVVLVIGYINLVAVSYFLCLLLFQRNFFLPGQVKEKPLHQTSA